MVCPHDSLTVETISQRMWYPRVGESTKSLQGKNVTGTGRERNANVAIRCAKSLSLSVLMPLGTSWQHQRRESNSPHSWQSVPHRARWRRSMERRAQHHRMAIPSHLGPSDSAIPLFWMQLLQYLQIFNNLQYISTIFYRDSVTEMSRLFTQGPRVQLS